MSDIREATDATFDQLVTESDRPVVVDFWAAWCGPCRLVAPEVEKLASKYAGDGRAVARRAVAESQVLLGGP